MTRYRVGRVQCYIEYILVEASSEDEAFDKLRDAMDSNEELSHVYFGSDGELLCEEVENA